MVPERLLFRCVESPTGPQPRHRGLGAVLLLLSADSKPIFVLRGVSLSGAGAIPHERIASVYQPYFGKKVSQADLAAIAAGVGDLYRAAGFHLSRAVVPPQDIRDGRVRIQVI